VLTEVWFITFILTIIIPVTKEVIEDATVVCTFELVLLADIVANLAVLIRAFIIAFPSTVIVSITHPSTGDAVALWTLELCILVAPVPLTHLCILIAPVIAVRRAVTLPVLADAALLVLAGERLGAAGVCAAGLVLPAGTVLVPVAHPAHVDTPPVPASEGGVGTAGAEKPVSAVPTWAVQLICAIPAVVMTITTPLGQDAVGGAGAVLQVPGPVLRHHAGGHQPATVCPWTVLLITCVRTVGN
jgi:hypothetical protein